MITVTGEIADRYEQYRDLRGDLMENIRTYRDVVAKHPARVDAATVAACLSGQVRFTSKANAVFLGSLGQRHGADQPSFAQLHAGIEVQPTARTIIEACVGAKCETMLAEALEFLFIETHPALVTVSSGRVDLASSDGDDDGDTPPDEPPEGWGGT